MRMARMVVRPRRRAGRRMRRSVRRRRVWRCRGRRSVRTRRGRGRRSSPWRTRGSRGSRSRVRRCRATGGCRRLGGALRRPVAMTRTPYRGGLGGEHRRPCYRGLPVPAPSTRRRSSGARRRDRPTSAAVLSSSVQRSGPGAVTLALGEADGASEPRAGPSCQAEKTPNESHPE